MLNFIVFETLKFGSGSIIKQTARQPSMNAIQNSFFLVIGLDKRLQSLPQSMKMRNILISEQPET